MRFCPILVSLVLGLSLNSCQNNLPPASPATMLASNEDQFAQSQTQTNTMTSEGQKASAEVASEASESLNVGSGSIKITLNLDHLSPEDRQLAEQEIYSVTMQPKAVFETDESSSSQAVTNRPSPGDPGFDEFMEMQRQLRNSKYTIYPKWSFQVSIDFYKETGLISSGPDFDSTWILEDVPLNTELEITVASSVPRTYGPSCHEITPQLGFDYSASHTLTSAGLTEILVQPQRFLQQHTSDLGGLECATTLSGQVFDEQGNLMSDARITLNSLLDSFPYSGEFITDANGEFQGTAPPGIEMEFIASKSGYVSQKQTVVLKSDKSGDPNTNRIIFGEQTTSTALKKESNA